MNNKSQFKFENLDIKDQELINNSNVIRNKQSSK